MDIGNRILKTRIKRPEFFSKEIINKVQNKKSKTTKFSSKLERVDSNRTTIDNVNISSTQNSEILLKKLRPFNIERPESEIRRLPSKLKERLEEIRKKSPFDRNYKILRPAPQKQIKIFDPKIRSPEMLPFLSSDKKMKLYINDNIKEDHKSNAELIPISLQYKKKLEPIRNGSKKNTLKARYLLDDLKNAEDQFTFFALDKSESGSPDIVKTLRNSNKIIVNDWKKSVLYQNIKYNRGSPVLFDGYYKTELIELASNIPLDSRISLVLEKLFCTLGKLFIQLLGSKEDLEKVKIDFGKATVCNVQFLIEKCLKLYEFRDRTSWIIESILRREFELKEAILGNKKNSNELFRITEKLQKKIKRWLKDDCAPFSEFVFNGINYLSKMNKDFELLQDLRYSFKV